MESLEGVDGVVGRFLPGRLGALEYENEDEDEDDDPFEGSEGGARAGRLAGVPYCVLLFGGGGVINLVSKADLGREVDEVAGPS